MHDKKGARGILICDVLLVMAAILMDVFLGIGMVDADATRKKNYVAFVALLRLQRLHDRKKNPKLILNDISVLMLKMTMSLFIHLMFAKVVCGNFIT